MLKSRLEELTTWLSMKWPIVENRVGTPCELADRDASSIRRERLSAQFAVRLCSQKMCVSTNHAIESSRYDRFEDFELFEKFSNAQKQLDALRLAMTKQLGEKEIGSIEMTPCFFAPGLRTRDAYMYLFGSPPPSICVCHKCDRPGCLNPEHWWLGTNYENIQDAVAKGRFLGKGVFKRRR